MSLTFRDYRGDAITQVVDSLARLRISVFRDWPYLYDGDLAYERAYLADYARGDSLVVAAFDGSEMVGASTGMPLSDHADDFASAFETVRIDFNKVFYCAESVLASGFRGQGAGHAFFDRREAHAKRLGFTFSTFCSVIRPQDHPARPAGYRPLDPFWRKRGYAPLDGVVARFQWRDIGDQAETEKPLQFWIKHL
ncbi:Histone acetyltransferase HPA2 [Roseibacterium elongatum DSM 19469]|uniref:Histone acetyltransferase HPA2 n=1 Tax=Roseicyclus elongatus DSM 19469 TaxID=1294273 RepID=W8S6B1_9RHOB|nr:GNAT family acetyltransferase [Roseibacterium elongatum]AHM05792.1 Histone acetyltransferase HPA2 [Roseibacterium elongatum DSM 19469]